MSRHVDPARDRGRGGSISKHPKDEQASACHPLAVSNEKLEFSKHSCCSSPLFRLLFVDHPYSVTCFPEDDVIKVM